MGTLSIKKYIFLTKTAYHNTVAIEMYKIMDIRTGASEFLQSMNEKLL